MQQHCVLFDHLIGAGEQHWRHFKAECLRRLEIDRQVVLGGRLHRQVGRLLALEDAVDVAGRAFCPSAGADGTTGRAAAPAARRRNRRRGNFILPSLSLFYSITSSARPSRVGGMSMSNALAVCRLMTSSNLVLRRIRKIGRLFTLKDAAGTQVRDHGVRRKPSCKTSASVIAARCWRSARPCPTSRIQRQ